MPVKSASNAQLQLFGVVGVLLADLPFPHQRPEAREVEPIGEHPVVCDCEQLFCWSLGCSLRLCFFWVSGWENGGSQERLCFVTAKSLLVTRWRWRSGTTQHIVLCRFFIHFHLSSGSHHRLLSRSLYPTVGGLLGKEYFLLAECSNTKSRKCTLACVLPSTLIGGHLENF